MHSIHDTFTHQPALRCTIADYNYTIRGGRLLKYSIPTGMLRALAVLKCTAVYMKKHGHRLQNSSCDLTNERLDAAASANSAYGLVDSRFMR